MADRTSIVDNTHVSVEWRYTRCNPLKRYTRKHVPWAASWAEPPIVRYSFANQVAGRIQQWDLVGIMSPSKRPARDQQEGPLLPFASSSGREPPSVLSLEGETHETPGTPADTLLPQYPSQRKQRVLADSFSCFPTQERVRSRRRPRLRASWQLRVDTPCKRRFISFFVRSLLLFLVLALCFSFIFSLYPFCEILLGLYVYLEPLYLGLRATTSLSESGC